MKICRNEKCQMKIFVNLNFINERKLKRDVSESALRGCCNCPCKISSPQEF